MLSWRRHWLLLWLATVTVHLVLLIGPFGVGGCGGVGVVRLVRVAGILLGPEETSRQGWGLVFSVADHAAHHISSGDAPCGVLVRGVGGGCVVWGCALFENYTVDASIFVVKLLRADGGCLGTRSR